MEDARAASAAEVARVAELALALRGELRQERGGLLWATRESRPEPLEAAIGSLLARDDAAVLVGTYDDAVVGYGTAWVDELRDGSRLGVIDEIYVEPEARGVGVGESLVSHLVAFCREAGCAGVDATALPGHRQAKNFFERAGFSARLLVMHHSIEGRSL
jgi:ribosomal protein S18 acetylase RimI-like enzyme